MAQQGRSSSFLQPEEAMESSSRRGSISSVRSGDSLRPGKRLRTTDVVEGEEKDMVLGRMRQVSGALRSFVAEEGSKISKASGKVILDKVAEYEELLVQVLLMNERIVGRMEEMKVNEAGQRSFSEVVGGGSTGNTSRPVQPLVAPKPAPTKTFALVIRAKDDKMSAENVKSKVLKEVQPEIGKSVKVKALRVVKNGGVAIEVTSEVDRELIRGCRKFAEAGLNVNDPRKIGPKVIVYDVPKDKNEGEFMKELYERNLRELMSEKDMKERVRIVKKNGKKDSDLVNIVMELPTTAKDHLLKQGRIYIDWCSYRINTFELVMRCHKCYGFNHRMNECKAKESTCRKCGRSGHVLSGCKEVEYSCGPCRDRGRDSNHSMMSEGCPEVVRALMRYRSRIDND